MAATMTAVDPVINDHLTRVQLRLIKEKLQQERQRSQSRPPSSSSTPALDAQTVKLHQAMLRRQELLDKIKQEREIAEELRRPRSYTGHRDRSPPSPAPSRRSLPDRHMYQTGRTNGGHHVVTHQFKPIRLEPIEGVTSHPQTPQIIQTVPQPYLLQQPEQKTVVNTKAEMMEMMMMQNAQMHQMMMQQLMLNNMPKAAQSSDKSGRLTVELDDIISLKSEKRGGGAVHHHHYGASPSNGPAVPPYPLPPVQTYPQPMPAYYSPRHHYPSYPIELEPLRQPRARPKRRLRTPPEHQEDKTPKRNIYGKIPFPGPWPLRKFRHWAYAAWFSHALLRKVRRGRKTQAPKAMDEDFLFGIRLKEAVAAMHKIYLNPEGRIYPTLVGMLAENSSDLTAAMNNNSETLTQNAQKDLSYLLENITYQITEIMPTSGVLGTHRKAVVYELIRSGNLFPRGYLWGIEKERLLIDHMGRIINVDDEQAAMLLIGIYMGRGLVTTLLVKPVEYGLTNRTPNYKSDRNLKMAATVFIYLVRRAYAPRGGTPLAEVYELGRYLFKDHEMTHAYKKLQKSLDYAEGLLRDWSKEYVKRLRNAV